MAFDLPKPGQPELPRTLPDTLKIVRDRSVAGFREKLGIFATDSSVCEYSDEINRLMSIAYGKGQIDGSK